MEVNVELSIKIRNDKEFKFSIEEAKEVWEKLDKIFGSKEVFYPYYPPQTIPTTPGDGTPDNPYPLKVWYGDTISRLNNGS